MTVTLECSGNVDRTMAFVSWSSTIITIGTQYSRRRGGTAAASAAPATIVSFVASIRPLDHPGQRASWHRSHETRPGRVARDSY